LPSIELHKAIILNQFIKWAVDSGEFRSRKYRITCPKCNGCSISTRTTIQPKYRCIHCHHVFDEEILTPDYHLSKEDFKRFTQKYRKQIEEKVNERRQDFFENEYNQFKDCIVLCKKCHLLHHKGKDLCPICKKNFKDLKHEMCWDCFVKSDLCITYAHHHCKKEFFFRKGSDAQYIVEKDTYKDLLCLMRCKVVNCSYRDEMFSDDDIDDEYT